MYYTLSTFWHIGVGPSTKFSIVYDLSLSPCLQFILTMRAHVPTRHRTTTLKREPIMRYLGAKSRQEVKKIAGSCRWNTHFSDRYFNSSLFFTFSKSGRIEWVQFEIMFRARIHLSTETAKFLNSSQQRSFPMGIPRWQPRAATRRSLLPRPSIWA